MTTADEETPSRHAAQILRQNIQNESSNAAEKFTKISEEAKLHGRETTWTDEKPVHADEGGNLHIIKAKIEFNIEMTKEGNKKVVYAITPQKAKEFRKNLQNVVDAK